MATATTLLDNPLSTLSTAKGRLEMNLNLKRVLPSDASKRSNLDPCKRQCQKLSSAEMCESDVSLSDDDGDELVILSRNMRAQSGGCLSRCMTTGSPFSTRMTPLVFPIRGARKHQQCGSVPRAGRLKGNSIESSAFGGISRLRLCPMRFCLLSQ